MPPLTLLLLFAGSYLVGAFPTAFLVAKKLRGIDIREHGSGNPGATNVYRVVGAGAGIFTFAVDMIKGLLPVIAVRMVAGEIPLLLISAGLAAIAGHVWTVFLRFKGGKGVATAAGVFIALLPVPALCALAVFFIVLSLSGYVSLGSIIAAVTLPVIAFFRHEPVLYVIFAFLVAAGIIYKHKSNIARLAAGKERKTQLFKKKNDNKTEEKKTI